jgi:hypothetical protein
MYIIGAAVGTYYMVAHDVVSVTVILQFAACLIAG